MSKVTFTESVVDTGVFVTVDSVEKKKLDVDNIVKYGVVSFGEGMILRDTLRNKIDVVQAEPVVKNIAASAISKAIGLGVWDYFSGKDLGMDITKKAIMAAVGTGAIKYYFNI